MQHARFGKSRGSEPPDLSTYLRQKPAEEPHVLTRSTISRIGSMHNAGTTLVVGRKDLGSDKPTQDAEIRSPKMERVSTNGFHSSTGPEIDSPNPSEPVTMTVWFHEYRAYAEDIMVDSGAIPGMQVGSVYSVEAPKKEGVGGPGKSRRLVFVVQPENLLSPETAKSRGNVQLSLHLSLQRLLDLPPRSPIQIQRVANLEDVELDAIEIHIKDVNFGRDAQWGLALSLAGTCCHANARVSFLGSRVGTIRACFKHGRKVLSGYIGANTNLVFRLESARLVFLVQMSREMWHFEENGEIMFHKLVNTLLPKVFKAWRDTGAHHLITIVLFTSVDLTRTSWIALGGGERPSDCHDYYRVVVDQVSVFIWDKIMASLRLEFANFKRDILTHLARHEKLVQGEFCPAIKGNLLEAIDVAMTLVCDRFRNTDLRHTINHFVVITAGTGLFDVDHDRMVQTSKKMFSLDCALDILLLSQPPLHTVPLFRYRDDVGRVAHCVPKWCDISFYSGGSHQQWIPQCKIYELQMMGVMENEVNEVQIERLRFKENDIIEQMDRHDARVFRSSSTTTALREPKKRQKHVFVANSTAVLALMGKAGNRTTLPAFPTSRPALALTNVSTTRLSALGTVLHPPADHSALLTLYTLNRADDGKREPRVSPLPTTLTTRNSSFRHRRSFRAAERPARPKKLPAALADEEAVKPSKDPRQADQNPYWEYVDNPLQKPNSDRAQCSRWAKVFPPHIRRRLFKWRSVKAPAALPIVTDLFPTARQLESDYTFQTYVVSLNYENELELKTPRELMREMIRLRLAMGFQICMGPNVDLVEEAHKGSPGGLIKYFPTGSLMGSRMYLSINDEIHRLHYDENGLNVQLYRKVKSATTPTKRIALGSRKVCENEEPLIRTRYADVYKPCSVKIGKASPQLFNWNQYDQLLAGYEDAVTEKQYYKMKFVVIPTDISLNAYYINNENLTDEELRVEGLRRLIALIERGKFSRNKAPRQRKEEIFPEIQFYTGNLYDFLSEQAELFDINGTRPQNSLMVSDGLRFNTNIRISSLAQELQGSAGLKLVDRTWHFKLHPQCFLGSELVLWLLEYFEDVSSRDDAVTYGQTLMTRGLFRHVENRHGFLDGHYFYEFNDEYADTTKRVSPGWFKKRAERLEKETESSDKTHVRKPSESDRELTNIESVAELRKVFSQTLIDSEHSSLTESQKAKREKLFMISKRVKFDCDPLQKLFRPELVDVHYDSVHNPEHCYHIRLQWLSTTTKFLDETIISWSRLCERHGLKLVETPWSELCAIPHLNPFHSFVELEMAVNPLLDPEFKDNEILKVNKYHYHLQFLKKREFLLDNRSTSFFLKDHIKICYSWGAPSFKYAQFIHKTGTYIVELRENGDFLMAPNNTHIIRMNTLINLASESVTKNLVFDTQKIMLEFRESCKDGEGLRELFRALEESLDNYGVDFMPL